jgi:hypothetical protein
LDVSALLECLIGRMTTRVQSHTPPLVLARTGHYVTMLLGGIYGSFLFQ